MLLIADSGSSKCEWVLVSKKNVGNIQASTGLNPYFITDVQVQNVITNIPEIISNKDIITKVCFYGAGCSDPERKDIIRKGIASILNKAEIKIEHDLYGAALATCGDDKGIACILGTGSNACQFDGQKIIQEAVSLGYVLGDEGGGVWLGKRLLRDYLYGLLPKELNAELANKNISRKSVLATIYQASRPNTFLASFGETLSKYRQLDYVQTILAEGFDTFIKFHIKPLNQADLPVHFIGSIAWYFKEELTECCRANRLTIGKVIQKPIKALTAYHFSKY